MTVQSQVSNITYYGDGTTKVFNYPFRITTADSLKVLLINVATGIYTEQILNTDYTVNGVNNVNGGTIDLYTAPPSGYNLFIARLNQKYIQEMSFLPNSKFDLASLEQTLDRLALQDQQLDLKHQATIKLSPNEIVGFTLVAPQSRRNTVLGFDENGNLKYETMPSGTPTGTFLQSGSGAIERLWQNKVRERFSVEDFGALGSTIEENIYIQAALNALNAAGGGVLELGHNKNYILNDTLNIYSNTIIRGNNSTLTQYSNANIISGMNINNFCITDCILDGFGGMVPSGGEDYFNKPTIGIYITGTNSSNIKINDNKFINCNSAIRISHCSYAVINNNRIIDCGFGGIRTEFCNNLEINANQIDNIQGGTEGSIQFGDAIYFDGCNQVTVSENKIRKCKRMGIVLEASNISLKNTDFIISNNIIRDLTGSIAPEYNGGIWVEANKYTGAITVTGNQIIYSNTWAGNKFVGILVSNGGIVTNNVVKSNTTIAVDGGAIVYSNGDTEISNNYIHGFTFGIYNSSQEPSSIGALYTIKNNIIRDCLHSGIYIYKCGTTFFIENNIIQNCGIGQQITSNFYAGSGIFISSLSGVNNNPKYSIKGNTFISSVNENDHAGQIYGVLFSRSSGGDDTAGCISFDNNTFIYNGTISTIYPNNLTFTSINTVIPVAIGRDAGGGSVSVRHDIVYDRSHNKSSKLPLGIAYTIFPALNDTQDGTSPRFVGHGNQSPVAGVYAQGDYVYNTQIHEIGSPGSKYTVQGWVCIASSPGSVGTWGEQRMLTGN